MSHWIAKCARVITRSFQRSFLNSNLFTAVALSVARICNSPDARTQLREMVVSGNGTSAVPYPMDGAPVTGDCAIWRAKYSEVVDWDRLDKLRMPKINDKTK